MFKTDFDLMSVVEEGLAGIPAALISYAWALLAFVIIVALVYLIAGRGNRNISAHKAVGYAFPDTFYRHSSSRVDFLNALLQFGGAQKWFASLSQWPPCLVCNVAVTMLFMVAFPHSAVAGASPVVMTLSVDLSSQGAEIAPEVYGQFIEHTGNVIYDGIWVGEGSPIPNIRGIRKDVVAALKRLQVPMLRWPGGCFADQYDWRDGIGPRDKRPKRSNFWAAEESPSSPAAHKYDPNQFGTNEFAQFCKLIGSQAFLAANLRSLPAEAFYHWVEYCNSPAGSTTLAGTRAAAGYADPFNVTFWGVGNESWGCGGNFTAQEYAVEFRRYAAWLPVYGRPLSLIASGPNGDDASWTRGFLEELVRKGKSQVHSVYGFALHHYAWNLSRGRTQNWVEGKGDAVNFDPVDWYELLREGQRMESMISNHWQALAEEDPGHSIKLVIDEWGPWYKPGSEATPSDQLDQMPTLRHAVFSGMTLHIFNRHP